MEQDTTVHNALYQGMEHTTVHNALYQGMKQFEFDQLKQK